jgi:hypothetical protein
MGILGGRWRNSAQRRKAIDAAQSQQEEERAAAFGRILGLAEQHPTSAPGRNATVAR